MRSVQVGAARLERWVAGFVARHPGTAARPGSAPPDGPADPVLGRAHEPVPDRVELSAPDGASAVLHAPFPPLAQAAPGDPVAWAAALIANGHEPVAIRALLVRRGGYACAVVEGDRITAAKVGSRHVQGRTAAGGWSQQRFARRRAGQTDQLVDAAAEVAVRLLVPAGPGDALVTGGDRLLVDRLLAEPRLKGLAELRRGPHLDVGDPRADLVRDLPERVRSIRIDLEDG